MRLIDTFIGNLSDRQLDAGESQELTFKFNNKIDTNQFAYSILVEFVKGCSVTFVPGS